MYGLDRRVKLFHLSNNELIEWKNVQSKVNYPLDLVSSRSAVTRDAKVLQVKGALGEEEGAIAVTGNMILFRFLQFIGSVPFSIDEQGKITFSWRSPRLVYSLSVTMLFTALAVFNFVDLLEKFEGTQAADRLFVFFSGLYSTIPVFSLLILKDIRRIVCYFEYWYKFQINFRNGTGRKLHVDNRKKQVMVAILCIGVGIFVGFYGYDLNEKVAAKYQRHLDNVWPLRMSFFYTTCVIAVLCTLFFYLLATMRAASEQLLHSYKVSVGEFAAIHRLWRELRELTCDLSWAFSSCLLFYTIFSFGLCMITWYSTIALDIGGAESRLAFSLGCTLWISIVPEFCHQTVHAVRGKFEQAIQEKRCKKFQGANEEELTCFEKTIADFPPHFTVAGFFTLNRNFNVSVCANFLQAMVIIYQMQNSGSDKNSTQL